MRTETGRRGKAEMRATSTGHSGGILLKVRRMPGARRLERKRICQMRSQSFFRSSGAPPIPRSVDSDTSWMTVGSSGDAETRRRGKAEMRFTGQLNNSIYPEVQCFRTIPRFPDSPVGRLDSWTVRRSHIHQSLAAILELSDFTGMIMRTTNTRCLAALDMTEVEDLPQFPNSPVGRLDS